MKRLHHLTADRSGAIALIFALSIVPLVLLVALAVDYAFYVQSRAQASLAADSAATHAVRAADAVYTYELSVHDANPVGDAEAAGSAIGKNWFAAALGTMTKASIANNLNNPTINLSQNVNGSAGFTATVNFAGTYPPFFTSLFNNKLWNINGNSQAQSAFSYVEILMLLDNSSSMLIASSPTAINSLEELTVCPSSGIEPNFGGNSWGSAYYQNVQPQYTGGAVPQNVNPETAIQNYTPGAYVNSGYGNSGNGAGYLAGTCNAGWQGTSGLYYTYQSNGTNYPNADYYMASNAANYTAAPPYAPCAFACHTTTDPLEVPKTINAQGVVTSYSQIPAYSNDYYGIARQAGIQLRLDVVQSAAAAVVTAMQANEQAAGQFSVGIYEFNDDVIPVWPALNNGQQPSEASTDLTGAATAIQSTGPPVQANANIGNTNFPASINDMISGDRLSGAQYRQNAANTSSPALTASGTGTTSTTPQKDVFIVTDGMEDTSASGSRVLGEMAGYEAETTAQTVTPALCKKLKTTLGYTVYVLYIDYNPLTNTYYQTSGVNPTQYGIQDFASAIVAPKYWSETTSYSQAYPPNGNTSLSPYAADEWGLIGCATNPSDFFEATSDAEIGTTMNAMLHAALTSTIQITQ